MIFEPIRAFNFNIQLPESVAGDIRHLFILSVESASIDFISKTGRITVRDFSDSGKYGIDLVRYLINEIIPEFRINLLNPLGEVARTYVLTDNVLYAATMKLSNGSGGSRKCVTNEIHFEFKTLNIVLGSENVFPDSVRRLELDYKDPNGTAELY